MELLELLKKKIADRLIGLLISLLAIPCTIFGIFFDRLAPLKIIEDIGSLLWSQLALWLLTVCILLIAYIIYQRPKLRFIQRLGVFVDLKSKQFFCPTCKTKKIMQPLRIKSEGLTCSACHFDTGHLSFVDREVIDRIFEGKLNKDL